MSNIQTGFSRLCITPPLGAPISGYYEARFTKGVLDDLYVTAVAFDDGRHKSVILAADIIMLSQKQCTAYRQIIADFCNLPLEAIFINCSHTHTGPMIGKDFASDLCSSSVYDEYLGLQMRDAAAYALQDLHHSAFYTATGKAKGISFIRRYRMKDGTVQTNPGVKNSNIDHALGTPNETVKLLKVTRDGADDIFIVNFGTHPDVIGGEYISADYPGFVRSTLENALPGTKCMFLLAPQGDVNHINTAPVHDTGMEITFDGCPRGYIHCKHMGRVIAGTVLQICDAADNFVPDCIEYLNKTVKIPSNQENHRLEEARKIVDLHESGQDALLPFEAMELTTVVAEATRIVKLENGPDDFEFSLSGVRLGDIAFAGIPGEPFTQIGNRICEASPFDTTFLCCLTNGGDSYFPTSTAYDEGGYESRTSSLKKGSDNIIVDETVALLNELKNLQ